MKLLILCLLAALLLVPSAQATVPNARIPVSKATEGKALKQIGQVLRPEGARRRTPWHAVCPERLLPRTLEPGDGALSGDRVPGPQGPGA